jgi:N-acetylmuramoyl-L-alanine amidase
MSYQQLAILREEEKMKMRSTVLAGLILAARILSMPVVPPTQAIGPLSAVKVCLDPGHGGDDPGTVNVDMVLSFPRRG